MNEHVPYRIALTGSSSGIGAGILKQLREDPLCERVYCLSRNHNNIKAPDFPKSKFIPIKVDLHTPDGLEKQLQNSPLAEERKLAILINNAGTLVNKPFEDTTLHETEAMFRVNFLGPIFLTNQLISKMALAPFKHIVNISSMSGFQGSAKFAGLLHYGATKAALASASESLAVELAGQGIAVNCLALGSVATNMFRKAFPGMHAQSSVPEVSRYILEFAKTGWKVMNGKVLPLAKGAP